MPITVSESAHKVASDRGQIRVLVVDDSVVIRRLITLALSEDPQIEVVGSASNGSIALERIPQCRPDVITLDIEMPVMDGLETLRRIRQLHPGIRVVMFSTLTSRGASATFEALSLGASDYLTKPSNVGSLDQSMASVQQDLAPKVKQFFTLDRPSTVPAEIRQFASRPPDPTKPSQVRPRVSALAPQAVLIGVSTGGPNALAAIVPQFPADFPVPILVVQHMPPLFTKFLAERLNTLTPLQVEEAFEGAVLEPGKIVIAPGDHHMQVRRKGPNEIVATLNQDPPENSCRPSVDVLFRSAAEVFGGSIVAVMLTGMGTDGLRGTAAVSEKGACVIAQDEASSTVWGMPGAIVRAGLANRVVALSAVVAELIRAVRS